MGGCDVGNDIKITGQKILFNNSGFSLLELLAVISIISFLSLTLGMVFVNQFNFWEVSSNHLQLINEANLLSMYLKQDIAESIDFELDEDKLYLHQDRTGDGIIDRVVKYVADSEISNQLKRVISYQDHLPSIQPSENIITLSLEEMNFVAAEQYELEAEIKLAMGSQQKEIDRSFSFTGKPQANRGYSLNFSDSNDYVALNNFMGHSDYQELTLVSRIKVYDTGGTIYGFDGTEYFSLMVGDNGFLKFDINMGDSTYSFSGNTVLNKGQEYNVAVVLETVSDTEKQFYMYIDGELDYSTSLYTSESGFGSGNTRYGFMGVDSEAEVFNGDRADNYFQGQIYWFQHWNKALTEEQLEIYKNSAISGEEHELKAYYGINRQDSILYDYSDNNHGIVVGPDYSRR